MCDFFIHEIKMHELNAVSAELLKCFVAAETCCLH